MKLINEVVTFGELQSTIVKDWGDTPSDGVTPSEKLVYDTISETEKVVAASLTDMNKRLDNILSMNITSNGVTLTLQEWIDRISSVTIQK